MSIGTLFSYLVGSRAAIVRIVNTPAAIWLGAIFVLSAGFAREYDAKDLVHEPWYLLVPLGASLATSFLLYCLIFAVALRKSAEPDAFWPTYRRFLSLYWLTAPLAWLYALPVDRVLPPGPATATNLALLGIVSVWRVALMTRVVSVYFGAGLFSAALLVMLFADSLALGILFFTPLPIIDIMGGIPLTESDAMIQGVAIFIGFVGGLTWPLWLIGAIVVFFQSKAWQTLQPADAGSQRVEPSLWCLASVAVLGWVFLLPITQAEQQLARHVEALLTDRHVVEAVDTMSGHARGDFPPNWDPPPWLGYRDPRPPVIDVLEVALDKNAPDWVRAIYVDKLLLELQSTSHGRGAYRDADQAGRFRALLGRLSPAEREQLLFYWAQPTAVDEQETTPADASRAAPD